jgi:methionyl-tRNA formyltransferase
MRLGIMAHGEVGRAVVDHILQTHGGSLHAIILNTADDWAALRHDETVDVIEAHKRLELTWDEFQTPAGIRSFLEAEIDILLLAWWPHLLTGEQISFAREATLNFHPSLLPHCRGKDPNFWSIVERSPFGVTIHHVDESIDGGPIAFQKIIPVDWEDTGSSLYRKAQMQMLALLKESLPSIIAGEIPRIPQDPESGSRHFRRELDPASRFDLDEKMCPRDLLNLLRARTFEGHPACRFSDFGATYEVRIEIRKI